MLDIRPSMNSESDALSASFRRCGSESEVAFFGKQNPGSSIKIAFNIFFRHRYHTVVCARCPLDDEYVNFGHSIFRYVRRFACRYSLSVPLTRSTHAISDAALSDTGYAALSRPLPLPAKLPPTDATRPLPAPRLRSPVAAGMHASPVGYACDRQRSLPHPSPNSIRSMPSMPIIRHRIPNPESAMAPITPSDQAFLPHREEQSLARQASTPNLQAGFPRKLPKPPAVPNLDPSMKAPASSGITPSPALSRALPSPDSASGRPSAVLGMDRSDTVSSINSLDRWELSRHAQTSSITPTAHTANGRPLPSPQRSTLKSGLGPSRSLDRGMLRHGGFLRMTNADLSQASQIRSTTGPAAIPSRILPNAPPVDVSLGPSQSARNPVGASPSTTSADAQQYRRTSGEGRSSTLEGDEEESGGQDTEGSAQIGQAGPVIQIAPLPAIVLPDSPDQPAISVARVTTPSSPIASVGHPDPIRDSLSCSPPRKNTEVDRTVPSFVVSGGNVPSISIEGEFLPATAPIASSSTDLSHSGPGIFCSACDLVILGSIINAAGKRWHPDCLRCTTCGVGLEHVSRYDHDGMPYCHMDYHEVSICGVAV